MTPKEKAEELFNKMYEKIEDTTAGMFEEDIAYIDIRYNRTAKQCAIIAVDEILKSRPFITDSQIEYNEYWQEIKQEIKKL